MKTERGWHDWRLTRWAHIRRWYELVLSAFTLVSLETLARAASARAAASAQTADSTLSAASAADEEPDAASASSTSANRAPWWRGVARWKATLEDRWRIFGRRPQGSEARLVETGTLVAVGQHGDLAPQDIQHRQRHVRFEDGRRGTNPAGGDRRICVRFFEAGHARCEPARCTAASGTAAGIRRRKPNPAGPGRLSPRPLTRVQHHLPSE